MKLILNFIIITPVPDTYLVELFKQGLKLLSQAGITLKIPIIEKFVASPYKIRLSLKNYKDMIEVMSTNLLQADLNIFLH